MAIYPRYAKQIQNSYLLFTGFKINLKEVNIKLQRHGDKTITIRDI
jgi:hypothetical protein